MTWFHNRKILLLVRIFYVDGASNGLPFHFLTACGYTIFEFMAWDSGSDISS